MALIDDLIQARKRLDAAWLVYGSLEPPRLLILANRIHDGERYAAQEKDPDRRARFQRALAGLRLEYAKLVDNDREARLLEQWNEAEEAFEAAYDAYMVLVRQAWKEGLYEDFAEQESEAARQEGGD